MDADSKSLSDDRSERDAKGVFERYHGQQAEGIDPSTDPRFGLARREHLEASAEQKERRRADLVRRATEEGIGEDLAGLLYDIALEEGLDPPLALELVRTGLSVAPPSEDDTPDDPVTDRYLPTWIFPDGDPEALHRERALRVTFRRFRALLEDDKDLETAFRTLANEPDVGYYGF